MPSDPPSSSSKGRSKKPKVSNVSEEPARDISSILSYGASLPSGFANGWSERRTEQVASYKHWVYIAVSAIARNVAKHPPNISRVYNKGTVPSAERSRIISPAARTKALTPLQTHQEIVPEDPDHPLCCLLRDPNRPDTASDIWYETILFLLLTGSAYWWMPRNSFGLPCAAWVIPSHWIWPIHHEQKGLTHWELRPTEGMYLRKKLPEHEVLHFRLKNPMSKMDGHSPTSAGSQWIDIADSNNRAMWFSQRNGTFPTVAIQFDGKVLEPSDEDLRRIEAKFVARYAGDTRANRPLFLPPGVKVNPLTIEPNKMVFGETADDMRDNILALFGVPKLVAGMMDGMTHGSVLAAQAGFCAFTLNPLLHALGQAFTEKLARLFDDVDGDSNGSRKIWWEDTSPPDPEIFEKQLMTDMMCGAVTPNEVRVLRGREPYPTWGNDPVFPVNMTTLPMGGKHQPSPPSSPGVPQPTVSDETSLSPYDHLERLMRSRANNSFSLNGHGH